MKKVFLLLITLSFLLISCKEVPVNFKIKSLGSIDSTLSFRGIFAVDRNTAYVSGTKGSLYFTKDGGENWEKISPAASDILDFRDVALIDQNTIVLMSAGSGSNSKIYKSTDNGKTWNIVYENPYPDGFLDTIEFWNDQKGIAIGDPVNGKFNILLTGDGGDSWYEADSLSIPKANSGEAQFAASGTCISVIGKTTAWIGTGGTDSRILKSTDNGKKWKTFESPLLQGKNSTGIFSIHFSNEANGFITGGDYLKEDSTDSTAAYSEDGGKSWRLVNHGILPYQSSVKSISKYGKTIYLSTGPAGSYFTEDKQNWELIGESGFHCMSISEIDNSIWVAGSGGRVAKIIKEK